RVLCRFTGGQPALVEKRFGQGRVILAGSTAGVAGNDLAFKPVFVPLIHQLTAFLASGQSAQRNLMVGDPIIARFDVKESGKPVRLTLPSGAVSGGTAVLGTQGLVFTVPTTHVAGPYRVGFPGAEGLEAYAVNLSAGE